MAYEYVMEVYGKRFAAGQRVNHHRLGGGEVKPEMLVCNMVMVQIDGMPFAIPCDPWDLDIEGKTA